MPDKIKNQNKEWNISFDFSEPHLNLDLNGVELLSAKKAVYDSRNNFNQKASFELLSALERFSGDEFFVKKDIFSIDPEYYNLIQFFIDKKILTDIPRLYHKFTDEMKLFNIAACSINQSRELSDGHIGPTINFGADMDSSKAILKSAMEGFERYCFWAYKRQNLIRANYEQLGAAKALHPRRALSYLNSDFSDSAEFYWAEGVSVSTGKPCFIPAQLIFWNYTLKNEPGLRTSISTGCAAGRGFEETFYRGLCEVIERDAFMIHWLKKITPPRIDLTVIQDEKIQNILESVQRYNLELFVLDITTDLEMPVTAAVMIDKTGKGPAVSVGASCGFSGKSAIIKAISEAVLVRHIAKTYWLNNRDVARDLVLENYFNFKESLKQNLRILFWSKRETLPYIQFLIQGKSAPLREDKFSANSYKEKLSLVLKILTSQNYDVFYFDALKFQNFGKEFQKNNLCALRAVVPGLQPLFLHDNYPFLKGERLEKAPSLLGQARDKNFFFPIPHPFP